MNRKATFLALIASAALSGCEQPAEQSTPASPKFDNAWIPDAPGQGNFEICLTKDAAENEVKSATIPAGVIFQSWGALTGPLRDADAFDHQSISASPHDNDMTAYATITKGSATLTEANPCQIVKADAVISEGFRFTHGTIPADLNYSFQAGGLMLNKAGRIEVSTREPLASIMQMGVLVGTPVDVISFSITATEDD